MTDDARPWIASTKAMQAGWGDPAAPTVAEFEAWRLMMETRFDHVQNWTFAGFGDPRDVPGPLALDHPND